MNPTLEPTDAPGLSLHDPIEGAQFELLTDRAVSPTDVDDERLPFPVDRAVSIDAGELVVPKLVQVTIRRPDGDYLSEYAPDGSQVVEHGDRLLDVASVPMLLYVHVPGPVRFSSDDEAVRIALGDPGEVVVGVRSFHERPAATVTVPRDPEGAMAAVSTFGSALKTTACERSYPTLRGHPPRVAVGSALSIPDRLESPDTGVEIRVPPSFEHVFPVAPLAYYLGATVEPGDSPAIHAGGVTHPLDGPGGFEATVHRTLRRTFFLDCVVRTEGIYQVPLAEREAVASLLPAGTTLGSLYGAPLPEQLATYLSLRGDAVDELLPEWPLCVDVAPTADTLEGLPYLVDDLALVRTATRTQQPGPTVASQRAALERAVDGFVRSDGGPSGDALEAAAEGAAERSGSFEETFRLPAAPAMEHAYLGPGCPLGVNKCSISTLQRRLDRSPEETPGISVRIVCNDQAMADEDVVEEYYGLRELVQFDVTVDYGLSTRDLRGVLSGDIDLVHYIGHIDDEGFACTDGRFDARSLDEVGIEAFLLNACSSYDQGAALVEAGAHGGVVTTEAVSNIVATAMGRTLSRALNSGFTLRSAVSLADEFHPTAYRYLVLGAGGLQLVQGDSVAPLFVALTPDREGPETTFRTAVHTYPAGDVGPGPFTSPNVGGAGTYLLYGHLDTLEVSVDELLEFFEMEVMPVDLSGTLVWSDELSRDDLQ